MNAPSSLSSQDKWSQYIGGAWSEATSGEHLAIEDPGNESHIADVTLANRADIDSAVQAAKDCVTDRLLVDIKPAERGRMLCAMSDWLEANRDELAVLLSRDSGKTLTEAHWEVDNATTFLTYYGGLADKIEGRYIPLGGSVTGYAIPVPYGVSAHIVPWNYPLEIAARGLGPALAAGNAVVIKSPELDPLSIFALAMAADDVGVPPGAINVVCGYGHDAGAALTQHPDVNQITFTGSVATGQAVLRAAAERIVPSAVELGGKSAGIVLADADLDLVVEQTRWAIWGNSGQICSALSRLVVPDHLHDEIVDRLTTRAATLQPSHGLEDADLGAMISRLQLEKVESYVRQGVDSGAQLACGGERFDRSGHFFQPTVFAGVNNQSTIAQEEIFGPVLCVIPYSDIPQALQIANHSQYGLVAGVFGNDLQEVTWLADRLDAGQIFVNDWFVPAAEAPFGGFKKSGFGREKGQAAVDSYIQWKNVAITRPGRPT